MPALSNIEVLFRDNYTQLCRVADDVVNDKQLARDIVQSFFLHCLHKGIRPAMKGNFKSYASQAVRKAALDYHGIAPQAEHNIHPPEPAEQMNGLAY